MNTPRPSRTRRTTTVLAAVALGATTLSGCQVFSPQQTLLSYAPADGIQLHGQVLEVRDLLLVSHGNGAPAVVSGTLLNDGTEPIMVTVTVAGQQVDGEIGVEPGEAVRLDLVQPDGSEVEPDEGEKGGIIVPALESPAGHRVEVRLSTGEETLAGDAPVLLPQGPYEQFADEAGGPVEPPQAPEGEDH